jgi:hypothetical protein
MEEAGEREGYVIQKNTKVGIVAARHLGGAEDFDSIVVLAVRAPERVSGVELAPRVIGKTAQDLHIHPLLNEVVADIVYPEPFGPKVLANHEDLWFGHAYGTDTVELSKDCR